MQEVKPKIYANMIMKEDEPVALVKRGLDSIKDHVDGLYITITYKDIEPTTSPLIDYLKSVNVHLSFFKWVYSFADARNYALEQVPRGPHI